MLPVMNFPRLYLNLVAAASLSLLLTCFTEVLSNKAGPSRKQLTKFQHNDLSTQEASQTLRCPHIRERNQSSCRLRLEKIVNVGSVCVVVVVLLPLN